MTSNAPQTHKSARLLDAGEESFSHLDESNKDVASAWIIKIPIPTTMTEDFMCGLFFLFVCLFSGVTAAFGQSAARQGTMRNLCALSFYLCVMID
jgi:hypothetical protein